MGRLPAVVAKGRVIRPFHGSRPILLLTANREARGSAALALIVLTNAWGFPFYRLDPTFDEFRFLAFESRGLDIVVRRF